MPPNEYDGVVRGSLKLKKPESLFKKKKKKEKTIHVEKTEAEKRYNDIQMKRKLDQVEKMASKTYKDRLKDYNEHLDRAPEQNDMPKVGPG